MYTGHVTKHSSKPNVIILGAPPISFTPLFQNYEVHLGLSVQEAFARQNQCRTTVYIQCIAAAAAYKDFSAAEDDLLAKLQKRGKSPSQVAKLMGRAQLSRRLIAHVRALVVVVF